MVKNLKNRLRKKEITIGSWITLSEPAIVEIMAKAGFDWLVVDMEHSALSFNQAQEIIRIIDLCNVTPLIRVMENNKELIKRFMDTGAHGVIVPLVNSRSDAERAVNAVKYPPLGTRGVGLSRAQGYGLDLETYIKWNQEKSIVIVQIEHIKAVENLEDILKVDGVDAFMVGPYDLSGSLNIPGEFEDIKIINALEEINRVANNVNISKGYHVVNPQPNLVYEKIKKGYTFIAYSADFILFNECCQNELRKIRSFL